MGPATPGLRFHAVSVACDQDACAAAQQLQGVRVLSADAPRLPLANCDSPDTCRCTYHHHEDRRAGPRRAKELGQLADPWSVTERRRAHGRRVTD
jgi:hypothetical protein